MIAKLLRYLVGAAGIEPATPTMSKKRPTGKLWNFKGRPERSAPFRERCAASVHAGWCVLNQRALRMLPALTLTACASTSLTETEDRIVIHHGLGGHLQSTEAVYEDIEAAGKPVVIDGHLHSADAFYGLALPGVCYTERASVSLHAISWLGLVPSAKHTGRMAKLLPGPVEAWFRDSMAFHDPIGWDVLSAEELTEIWPEGEC